MNNFTTIARRAMLVATALAAALPVLPAGAQNAAPATVRMRGTIQATTPTSVTVKDAAARWWNW